VNTSSWQSKVLFGLGLAVSALLMAIPESRAQSQDAPLPVLSVPQDKLPPPLSVAKALYFQKNPAAWSEFVSQLPQRRVGPAHATSQPAPPAFGGSWAEVTAAPGTVSGFCNPLLLTDGTVLVHDCDLPDWWKLTPDITGSYANGTWTQVASLPVIDATQYEPLYHASAVLPDGRVIIMGGEYNGGGTEVWTSLGAIYDPLANTWTAVTKYSGQTRIGDAQSVVLANGTFMLGSCCDSPDVDALFNATTLGWTGTGAPSAGGDYQDEQNYNLLPNGKALTIDIWTCAEGDCTSTDANPTNAELYTASTGLWTNTGSTVTNNTLIGSSLVDPYQCGNFEIGPAGVRSDGSLVAFGGNSGCQALVTALGTSAAEDPISIYNYSAGTWSAAPNVPAVCTASTGYPTTNCTLADAPAAVLPNGNILFAASGGYAAASGTFFFEFTSATSSPANTPKQVASELFFTSGNPSYLYNFLVLPNGQVFSADQSSTAEIYTPTGAPSASWAPTITSAPAAIYAGATYPISGTQFNGLTQGAYYGDDAQASTNYPIVKITNTASGHVFYARTFNHSTMSIAPGTSGSTNFTVPENVETGPSNLVVIANGIASTPVSVAAQHSGYEKPPDFNGDGDSDLLFHNTNGDIQVWLMNGGTVSSKIDLGILDNEWSIVGTGDFNGDGTTDVLLRNNDGDVQVWLMSGGSISSIVDLGTTSNAWTIVGTGDYNGDGTDDILLRNANGAVEIWFMSTSGTVSSTAVVATVANSWTIVGTGDYNGAGKADILWRNSNGDGSIWYMDGATRTSQYTFGPIATSWTIVGSGDFDGNGTSDILWRNSNGDGSIWFMNTSGTLASRTPFGPVATSWSVIATSAFSGGDADMLWRNANGQVEIWFMDGGTRTSTSVVGTFPFTNTVVQ
jgi:hypothetical protein